MNIYRILEKNIVPEWLIRMGIRNMLAMKLREITISDVEERQAKEIAFVEDLKRRPIAIRTEKANEQHYEVPTEFFLKVLGPNMKYSCALFDNETQTLEEAEVKMLELTCQRAELRDGHKVLELGCGWGSLSLFMAEKYKNSQIVAVSNSSTQKSYIDEQARKRNIKNLQIITQDMNDFDTSETFDRIVSVEMFEHLKNYREMFQRISRWMQPSGRFFLHIFTHHRYAYHYENIDGNDWLTEYFFQGGMMPSDNLVLHFQEHLQLEKHWCVSGRHYQLTSERWLARMKENRAEIEPILAQTYGKENVTKWWVYWQLFFLACAELWGYKAGNEWLVSHYLFKISSRGLEASRQS